MIRYRLNHAALRALAHEWGIKYPVEFRRTGYRAASWGQCRTYRSKRHLVTLDSYIPVDEVGDTIAHELCHAHQAEAEIRRGGYQAWVDRWNRERVMPHPARPMEIEAYKWGEERGEQVFDRCIGDAS